LFFCSGIILGGIAGVFIYNKQLAGTDVKLTSKDGVMIGILCGILSGILVSSFNFIFMLIFLITIQHNEKHELRKMSPKEEEKFELLK